MERATNNITPFGLVDTYTISYGGRSYSAVRTIVYKAANQYCEKQGKHFSIQNEEKRTGPPQAFGSILVMHSNVVLVFKCIQGDDQEVKKVDPQKVTSYGTCFAVSPTEVLTSHHVIAGADVVTVQFQGGDDIGFCRKYSIETK
jgi:S1-C subfamily serine protease